jgi:hypothetical protein
MWRIVMEKTTKSFELFSLKKIDGLGKLLSLLLGLAVFFGGACIALYALSVGYFPEGMSTGDTVVLLIAAAVFAYIYAFFVWTLLSLGMCIFYLIVNPSLNAALKIAEIIRARRLRRCPYSKKKKGPLYKFAPFTAPLVVPALIGAILIFLLGKKDPNAWFLLPLCAIAMFVFYSAFFSAGKTLSQLKSAKSRIIYTDDNEDLYRFGDENDHKQARWLGLAMLIIAPIVFAKVGGTLIVASMRMCKIRREDATIYVKAPYANFVDKAIANSHHASDKPTNQSAQALPDSPFIDAKEFDHVTVLFSVIGKNTVVAVTKDPSSRPLVIPDDFIRIE